MRKTFFTLALIFIFSASTQAQVTRQVARPDYTNDTKDINSILIALYDVISGEPGEARDWNRFYNLFTEDAKLIATSTNKSRSKKGYDYYSSKSYQENFVASRSNMGFYEVELNRVVEQFGAIAHVWSTYETREFKDGPPTNRGINSIQLLNMDGRWYVMNIYWSSENDGFTLPPAYIIRRD